MLALRTDHLGWNLSKALEDWRARLEEAQRALEEKRKDKGTFLGWVSLPEDTETLRAVRRYREGMDFVDDLVQIGIGGSSLGAMALEEAVGERRVRVHYVDHVEPTPLRALLDRLDPERTLVHVVSKSGTTLETLSAFALFLDWLKRNLSDWRRHVVVTTDPEEGPLRRFAEEEGLASFSIPKEVGGRYSALSPVGLLPLAFSGADLESLLAGARMANEVAKKPLEANLSLKTALIQHLAYGEGRGVTVFMPYSARMRYLPGWFVQLHDESLGKRTRQGKPMGTTAVPALGPQDQHAQVQLFREGPKDKLLTLILPLQDEPLFIPEGPGLPPFLPGKSFLDVLHAEALATEEALAEAGQRVYTLTLDRVDAYHLGWLLQHLMWQTAYLGELWGVNAFDQPGVELGKRLALARLERGR
ncbi:MAG: glucose-6-phosphate isomerase [Thermaceae bacterium]